MKQDKLDYISILENNGQQRLVEIDLKFVKRHHSSENILFVIQLL